VFVRRAFTLVELLMVTAIICVIAAITVPLFVHSIKGNRLRAACRTVISAGKFARSMALLQQQDMRLVFDTEAGRVLVYSLAPAALQAPPPEVGPAAAPAADVADDSGRAVEGESEAALDAVPANEELRESLDGVKLTEIVVDEKAARSTGRVSVKYSSNGRCVPYKVKVVDERGLGIVIVVDGLGAAEVEDMR